MGGAAASSEEPMSVSTRKHQMPKLLVLWLAAVLGMIIILICCTVVIPTLLYPSLSGSQLAHVQSAKDRIQLQDERLKLQNDARTTLLQGLGALFFVITAYFSWQQVQHNRKQLEQNREQFEAGQADQREQLQLNWRELKISQEGQVTERITRALEQLGHNSVAVQIGGIFALERVAQESRDDRRPIYETLGAYVKRISTDISRNRCRVLERSSAQPS